MKKAFTLIELLVVIAIIAILASLLVSGIVAATKRSKQRGSPNQTEEVQPRGRSILTE